MNNANAILFLGSGATAASGITNLSQQLPTDGQFFGSRLVETFLTEGSGGFPAIRAAREKFKIENPDFTSPGIPFLCFGVSVSQAY